MQNLKFDSKTHTYTLDEVKLPSVTQVIGGAGLINFGGIGEEIMRRAQLFGTATHLACALDDRKQLDIKSLDPALLPYLEAWRKFKKDFGITGFLEIEKQVYSKQWGYAGCLDRLTYNLALIEIKTSTTIPITAGLQMAGYQQAYQEMTKVKIRQRLCVQLLEGTYKLQEYKDKSDFRVFASCLNILNFKKINNIKEKQDG